MMELELFDKIINVVFMDSDGNESFRIDCPTGGMKPSLAISFKMLPESTTVSFRLVLENYMLSDDPDKYSTIAVEAGYPKNRIHFTLSIFGMYVESPNPSGKTVFTGLTGSWSGFAMNKDYYKLVFQENIISPEDLVFGLFKGVGKDVLVQATPPIGTALSYTSTPIEVSYELPSWVNSEYKINLKSESPLIEWTGESPYAIVNWLQGVLTNLGNKIMEDKDGDSGFQIISILDGISDPPVFRVYMKNQVKDGVTPYDPQVVHLERVTTVSMQGALLNVVAPWVPELTPGGVFAVNTRFIRGRMYPQQLIDHVAGKLFGGKREGDVDIAIYRVLQMSVTFDTCGSSNQMEVLAYKVATASLLSTGVEFLTSAGKSAVENVSSKLEKEGSSTDRDSITLFDTMAEDAKTITFGVPQAPSGDTVKDNTMLETGVGMVPASFAASGRECVLGGDGEPTTLSELAEQTWGEVFSGQEFTYVNKDGDELTGTVNTACLWPLIIAATKMKNEAKSLSSAGKPYADLSMNPDQIKAGDIVFIPNLNSISDLKSVASVFQYYSDNWDKLKGTTVEAGNGQMRMMAELAQMVVQN